MSGRRTVSGILFLASFAGSLFLLRFTSASRLPLESVHTCQLPLAAAMDKVQDQVSLLNI